MGNLWTPTTLGTGDKLAHTREHHNVADYIGSGSVTTGLQNAITAAGAGGVLLFPPGNYSYTTTLAPLRDQVWIGSGQQTYSESTGGTRLLYTGSDFGIQAPTRNLSISNMKIECASPALGCVKIVDPSVSCTFEQVTFKGYDLTTPTGVQFTGQSSCTCSHEFRGCTFHTLKRVTRMSGFANANLFQQCTSFNVDTGFDLSPMGTDTMGGQNNTFLRCEFDGAAVQKAIIIGTGAESNVFFKTVTDSTTGSVEVNAHRNHFYSCSFANAPTFPGGSGVRATTVFLGCFLGSSTDARKLKLGDTAIWGRDDGTLQLDDRVMIGDGIAKDDGKMQILQLTADEEIEFLVTSNGTRATHRIVAAGTNTGDAAFEIVENCSQANAPNNSVFLDSADNNIKVKDNAGTVVPLTTAAYRVSHSFAIKGSVANTDTLPTFFVPESATETVTLAYIRYKIRSGSAVTFRLLKNGSEFGYGTTGSPLSAGTTAASTTSAQALAADDEIELDLIGGGPGTDLTVSLMLEHKAA